MDQREGWILNRLPVRKDADADVDGNVIALYPDPLWGPELKPKHFGSVEEGELWKAVPLCVRLTYFKRSGKFYGDGHFEVASDTSLLQVWDTVNRMRADGNLPGLINGAGKRLMVLVNVPGHPNEHPHLIV